MKSSASWQYVSQSPWEFESVREGLALRMCVAVAPLALTVDGIGFPRAGRYSASIARPYLGTLDKAGSSRVGASVSAASEAASCLLDWRLFLPVVWDDDAERRAKEHLPESERHCEERGLALRTLNELRGW